MKFAFWVHLRTAEIKTEYCFFKDAERIVFMVLGVMMKNKVSYKDAQNTALHFFEVSPFSVYHPEVIKINPSSWGKKWFEFWGIER